MYLSLLVITFLLVAPSHTFPVDIQARVEEQQTSKSNINCEVDGKGGPCICQRQFTIRQRPSNYATRCAKAGSFQYENPSLNVNDGTVKYVSFASNSPTKTINCGTPLI